MKLKSTYIVLLLTLIFSCGVAGGQGAGPKKARTAEDYEPRSLKEVVSQRFDADSRGDKQDTMKVNGDLFPSRVRVTYSGSSRRLPQVKKDVLLQWARFYAGYPEGFTAPYETEMLFAENGVKYWLAVRTEAIPHYRQELKKGDQVELFLVRLGAARIAKRWETMLLVESYQKPK